MKEQTNNKKEKIIISLTSFPPAIQYVAPTVKSLLRGSVLPDKIVLYLTFSQFGPEGLPSELLNLAKENPIFEIRNYDKDIKSYRKLIPALNDFPDAVIVTVDDDTFYHKNMLLDLLTLHSEIPNAIIAHRVKKISLDKPYKRWSKYRWYNFLFKRKHISFHNLQTGVAGVLYPINALKKEMLNEELFTKIAPTTDDFWFWASAAANNVPVVPVPFGRNKPKGVGKPKEISLKTINFKSGSDRNYEALKGIFNTFPQIKEKLINE